MTISLPYGKGSLKYTSKAGQIVHIMGGGHVSAAREASPEEIVRRSMEQPIGTAPLWELARGKETVTIICSDHTRPVPSKVILPRMLAEIRRGNPGARIRLLIATGCHRSPTREELCAKFGPEIVQREEILIHDCEDEKNMVHIGVLPSGGRLEINRIAVETDLLVAEGFIEPHFFAGYSGGRKSVLPGVASRTCVHYNHNSSFMDHPRARAGCLEGNPIHEDMVFAARAVKLAYIVNVVLNSAGEIVASYAGDCVQAHKAGTDYVAQQTGCPAVPAPMVITTNNGYPLDQNIYQMVKSICTAESVCIPGGAIIAVGQCADGAGGAGFLNTFRQNITCQEILEGFRETPPERTLVDQWQSHILARILDKYTVILVSDADDQTVRDLRMHPAHSLEEAVYMAEQFLGQKNPPVTVIPEGISVIVLPPKDA